MIRNIARHAQSQAIEADEMEIDQVGAYVVADGGQAGDARTRSTRFVSTMSSSVCTPTGKAGSCRDAPFANRNVTSPPHALHAPTTV